MCIWSVLFYVEPFNKFKRNVDIVCLLSNEHTLLLKTANKIHWENNSRYEFSGEILFYMSLCHPSSFFVLFNSSMLVFVSLGFSVFCVFSDVCYVFVEYLLCSQLYFRSSEIAYARTFVLQNFITYSDSSNRNTLAYIIFSSFKYTSILTYACYEEMSTSRTAI